MSRQISNTIMIPVGEYEALLRDAELGSKLREMVNAGKIDVRNIMALFPNLRLPGDQGRSS